jgi:hypothetical protein
MRFASALLLALLVPHTNPHPTNPGKDTNTTQGNTKGTQDDPLVVHIKGTEASEQETSDSKKKADDEAAIKVRELRLTGFIALATVMQAIAAIVQICIYSKQSKIMGATLAAVQKQANTMEGQTDILKDSVATAQRSAETTAASFRATIDKERARLSLEIGKLDFGETPSVNYKITCHGTTPAYVVSSWQTTSLCPVPDFGWPKEAFGFELDGLPSVIPTGVFEGRNFIMGTDRNIGSFTRADWGVIEGGIYRGESYLHFRVRVLYQDVFDDARTHELQISKVYGVKLQELPQTLLERLTGKPADMVLGKFPEWSDSVYKFGQTEEER